MASKALVVLIFDVYIGNMKMRCIILLIFAVFAKEAFAQKDTLVYFLTAAGDQAPSRQDAYCKLVVFPVGSGSGAKLSAIKGYSMYRKLIFSGSSSKHGFPVSAVGPFTEYYPDGAKKSVKTFSNGFPVGDETDYYPNGKVKSSQVPNSNGDADKMEYYEDGTLKFEHHPTVDHQFKETYYYQGGKVARTVFDNDWGPNVTEYFANGNLKLVEAQADKGKKTFTTAYFPNGNIYYKFERWAAKNPFKIQYVECRDSTGKILAQNGNGRWVEYDENFELKSKTGKIENRLADSVWTIHFLPNMGLHETYEKGKLISSVWFQTKDTSKAAEAEVAPEFPGGMQGLNSFLGKNMRYPAIARENNTQGRVILSFVVETDGTLSDIRIVTAIGDGCDDEAVRVLKTSPPWKPGTKKGIPARVKYAIPIYFSLSQGGNTGVITIENP